MSKAVRCDACGVFIRPQDAYWISVFSGSKRIFESDLCAACKNRVIETLEPKAAVEVDA